MPIHLLPDTIASQIAAGEVVERPSSVVKELIENSIDAGAKTIAIEIEQAGRRLIAVRDDGCGIPSTELPLAVSRHATSKLNSAKDLFDIKTLGFRGEALASIGSVGRLRLQSKTAYSEVGSEILVDGGKAYPPDPIANTQGTSVIVQDLFFNVPARLKFLKSDITENRQITGLVTRYALAYPTIRWSLLQEGKRIFQTSGSGEKMEILQSLFGSQDTKLLMPIEFRENQLTVDGFISNLSLTRSNRKDITLFVNGRWVQDSSLTAAVIRAYNTLLMVGRFPVVILFLHLPTHLVDVNVHPSKAEVRFRESEAVFSAVQRAIRNGLLAYTPIPDLNTSLLWGRPIPEAASDWQKLDNTPLVAPLFNPGLPVDGKVITQTTLPGEHLPLLRLIGQVASTYLVAEGPDGLYLIDQHAAHERVLFDQLMAQFQSSAIPSQTLLQPAIIELTNESAGTLEQQLPTLSKLGFEVEPFGPNTYQLRSLPAIFDKGDPKQAILSVISAFEEDESPLQNEIEARVAARVCKRMAVKAGQILSEAEQRMLLINLESSQSPRTCPHGRPTMIHLSASLLERQFGRTGAI